ncbi:MAG: hypothetical protein A2W91_19485 [Bacteroidetes bacterium GWF2_38_335]|nr:MAG: hypothetical protein A2W91_19485 [Bacteroidetes bacterium GWF2_38_335]OFY79941.1 MAG: hypothetical protein A2281_10885 [Bacteroidetes bacterium RIFOXYA12_FULL_38_20]HBS86399.1 hypothetical protein [Bacteroidales bacterium]
MKRTLLLSFIAATFVFAFTQCSDCKECKQVVRVDGTVVDEVGGEEYCGEDLDDVESQNPDTVGSQVTTWECE